MRSVSITNCDRAQAGDMLPCAGGPSRLGLDPLLETYSHKPPMAQPGGAYAKNGPLQVARVPRRGTACGSDRRGQACELVPAAAQDLGAALTHLVGPGLGGPPPRARAPGRRSSDRRPVVRAPAPRVGPSVLAFGRFGAAGASGTTLRGGPPGDRALPLFTSAARTYGPRVVLSPPR